MTFVSDTSPLNYLIQIGYVDLLPEVADTVLIPNAVEDELRDGAAPQIVRDWLRHAPPWLQVVSAPAIALPNAPLLDPGEREAVQLALHLKIQSVLMDDAKGRLVAEALGLEVTGTLAFLETCARRGRCTFREGMERLESTTFRMSGAVRAAFLSRNP